MYDQETKTMAVKSACAWCGVGVSKYLASIGVDSWSEFAAFVASIYTVLLIVEWLWKKASKLNKD